MISEEGKVAVDPQDTEYFEIAKEVRKDAEFIREWFLKKDEKKTERELYDTCIRMVSPTRRLQCVRGCMSEAVLGLLHCAYSSGELSATIPDEPIRPVPQTPSDIACITLANRYLTPFDRHQARKNLSDLIQTTHPSYVLAALLQLRTPTQNFLERVLYPRQLSDLLDETVSRPQGITSLVNTLLNGVPEEKSAGYHNVVKIVVTIPRCVPSAEQHVRAIAPEIVSIWKFIRSNLSKTPPHLYHFFCLVMEALGTRFPKLFFRHILQPTLAGLELTSDRSADEVTTTIDMMHCLLICSRSVVVNFIELRSEYLANLLSLYTLVRESVLHIKGAVLELAKDILQAAKPASAAQVIIKFLRETPLREQREIYEFTPSDTGGVKVHLSTFEIKQDQTRLADQHYIDAIISLLTSLKKQSDIPGELILQILDTPSSNQNPILFNFALQIISELGIRVMTSGSQAGRVIAALLQDPENEENVVTGLTLLQLAVGDKLMMAVTTAQLDLMIAKIEQIPSAADAEIHQMASSCLLLLREFKKTTAHKQPTQKASSSITLKNILPLFSKTDSGAAFNLYSALEHLDNWCDNKPDDEFGTKDEIQYLIHKVNEIPPTAPEKERRLALGLRDKLRKVLSQCAGYSSIIRLFRDADTSTTGHALVELKHWIADKRNYKELMEHFDDVFGLLMGFLSDDESYLYLSAENALISLCDASPMDTLQLVSNSYSRVENGSSERVSSIREARRGRVGKNRRTHARDFRLQNEEEETNRLLKMADLIIYCIERGGEGCHDHGVIAALLSRCHHSCDSAVRASALQVLGQFSLHSRWLLLPHLRLIITTAQNIISMDKYLITLRASASLLYHIFCSFSTEAVTVLSEFIPSILEIAVANECHSDPVTSRYCQLLIKQANSVRLALYGVEPDARNVVSW